MASGADSGSLDPTEALARLQLAELDAISTAVAEQFPSRDGDINHSTVLAQETQAAQALFSRALQSGLVAHGTPAAEFVTQRGWYRAILDATEEGRAQELALQQRMLDDVEAGKLAHITDRSEYIREAEWEVFTGVYADDNRNRMDDLYDEMIDRVLSGESPYDARTLFAMSEWDAWRASFTDEKDSAAAREIFNRMLESVFQEGGTPYGPDELFQKAAWDEALKNAADDKKELLEQAHNECRAQVLRDRGWTHMSKPLRALFDHAWKALEEDLDQSLMKLRALAEADFEATYDEEELILPPFHKKPAEMSEDVLLEQVIQHVWNERRLAANKAWLKKAEAEEDIAQKANWLNLWQQMQSAFKRGGSLYRPDNIPTKVDLAAQARELGFDNVDGLHSGHWQYHGMLGQGGNGVATIWVKLDGRGKVVDHEVVKDTYLRKDWEHDNWDHPAFWHGPVEDRVPLEYEIVRELRRIPNSENIVEYHAMRIYEEKCMYRIYMEYAEHGSLHDLLQSYRAFGEQDVKDQNGNTLPNNVPLRLAWSIFAQLAKALCLAHNGRDIREAVVPEHDAIVHRDIKCGNIFVASREKALADQWPGLPIFKLADWGLACRKSNEVALRVACGTRGWKAPELYSYEGEDKAYYSIPNVNEKSDVFSIALVVFSLLNLDPDPKEYTFKDEDREWILTHPNMKVYNETPKLLDWLKECLRKNPQERPSSEELLERIEDFVTVENEEERPWKRRRTEEGEVLLWNDSKYLKWAQ